MPSCLALAPERPCCRWQPHRLLRSGLWRQCGGHLRRRQPASQPLGQPHPPHPFSHQVSAACLVVPQSDGPKGLQTKAGLRHVQIQAVSMTCRRPTFAETKRVVRILTSVYLKEAPAQPSQPQAKAASKAAGKPAATTGPQQEAAVPDKEDEAVPAPRLHRAALAGDADKVCCQLREPCHVVRSAALSSNAIRQNSVWLPRKRSNVTFPAGALPAGEWARSG